MKYLCKKAKNNYFIVGKYYNTENDDNYVNDGFIKINGHMFYDFPEIKMFNINDYFDTTKEIRRKKLDKLKYINI